MSITVVLDAEVRAAFAEEMKDKRYGEMETLQAYHFFLSGWNASGDQLAAKDGRVVELEALLTDKDEHDPGPNNLPFDCLQFALEEKGKRLAQSAQAEAWREAAEAWDEAARIDSIQTEKGYELTNWIIKIFRSRWDSIMSKMDRARALDAEATASEDPTP